MEEADPHYPYSKLCEEAHDLYIPSECPVLNHKPTALEFYRDFVSANLPVIIKDGSAHWPASTKWTNGYLRKVAGDLDVTIDATPNGFGDSVVETEKGLRFVKPEERQMKFFKFIDEMEKYRAIVEDELDDDVEEVLYAQHQNSSFRTEFQPLWDDVDDEIDFASEAFASSPQAVNFWMGDERSISSMHKDPFENLYGVVRGEKTFVLLPPFSLYFLEEKVVKSARYKKENGEWTIEDDEPESSVPWITLDPDQPGLEAHPKYRHIKPIYATVCPGDLLYLPSLWYHKVLQSADTIAVNYWYDMRYGINYCYYTFIRNLLSRKVEEEKEKTKKHSTAAAAAVAAGSTESLKERQMQALQFLASRLSAASLPGEQPSE